jgi:hypothetical protein
VPWGGVDGGCSPLTMAGIELTHGLSDSQLASVLAERAPRVRRQPDRLPAVQEGRWALHRIQAF